MRRRYHLHAPTSDLNAADAADIRGELSLNTSNEPALAGHDDIGPQAETQRVFWNAWNVEKRQRELSENSTRQKQVVLDWLRRFGRRDLSVLEVGCGAAWLTPHLATFGKVTATDLSDAVIPHVAPTMPEVKFVTGDFGRLDFPHADYDVVVTLEVLAHVPDQRAFVKKIASHLKPGGQLMLATQNRPVLETMNHVPATSGQIRKWVDQHELRALLSEEFEVLELFSVAPAGNRGIWRFVNSRALNAPVRAVFGNRVERLKERMGWGWTLMALARKR